MNVSNTELVNQNVEDRISLGPTVEVFWERCLQEAPYRYVFAWTTAGVAVATTLVIGCRHRARLSRAPICLQQGYYQRIVFFPIVFGLFSFISLLCPRAWSLVILVHGQCEAVTLSTFGVILFMLLSIESSSLVFGKSSPDEENVGYRSPNSELSSSRPSYRRVKSRQGETIRDALKSLGPKRHFAVPPLGCCFFPCMRDHHLSAGQLLTVSWLVKQYVFATIFLDTVGMWCALALRKSMALKAVMFCQYSRKISGLLAIYGLMVMYLSTKQLLHHWSTTKKFFSIKLLVLLSIVQENAFKRIIEVYHDPEHSCLIEPGHEHFLDHIVHFWTMYFICIESVVLACLVSRAFPASEVRDYKGHHLDLVEVELEQICTRRRREDSDVSDEEAEDSTADSDNSSEDQL